MQHCGVHLIAHPEELRRVDQVFRIEGKTAGLHGALNGGTSNTASAGSLREGEFGHEQAS
jgi:hypothetical protein